MGKGLPYSLSRGGASAPILKAVLPVEAVVAVAAAGAGVGFGTTVIGDLPEGNIQILGAVANLAAAGSGSDANLTATWNGDFSIGSTATADATLSSTDADIIASTAIGPAVAEVAPAARGANGTPFMLNNTDGSLELNLNFLIDAADITDASSVNITVTGTVYILYSILGDD
jgi:hypothetical protein